MSKFIVSFLLNRNAFASNIINNTTSQCPIQTQINNPLGIVQRVSKILFLYSITIIKKF